MKELDWYDINGAIVAKRAYSITHGYNKHGSSKPWKDCWAFLKKKKIFKGHGKWKNILPPKNIWYLLGQSTKSKHFQKCAFAWIGKFGEAPILGKKHGMTEISWRSPGLIFDTLQNNFYLTCVSSFQGGGELDPQDGRSRLNFRWTSRF